MNRIRKAGSSAEAAEKHPSNAMYSVRFTLNQRWLDDGDEDRDLVTEYTGKIIHLTEDEREISIGRVRADRVDYGEALSRGIPFYEVFDLSGALEDFYEALFDSKTDDFRNDLEIDMVGDILVVHTVEIVPKYRGWNLGLLSMLQTIRTAGAGCAMVAIKPFPLQFAGKVTEKNTREFNQCQEKLRAYWERLGFQRISATECYYLDLACRIQNAQEIIDDIRRERP